MTTSLALYQTAASVLPLLLLTVAATTLTKQLRNDLDDVGWFELILAVLLVAEFAVGESASVIALGRGAGTSADHRTVLATLGVAVFSATALLTFEAVTAAPDRLPPRLRGLVVLLGVAVAVVAGAAILA